MTTEFAATCATSEPAPQETFLLALSAGAYDSAAEIAAEHMRDGASPSSLSVLRPELLLSFARAWRAGKPDISVAPVNTYKAELFDAHAARALEGSAADICALPKFATSLGQLAIATELVLAHKDAVQEWQTGRQYMQYLGTFDPQHIGHRIVIQSALGVAGDRSSALVHVMGQHPFKPSFSAPYETRYLNSEERLYRSPLLDNTRVTQVDVPGGAGLANKGLAQMKLIADVCGDKDMRWLIGSDKFMLDAAAIRQDRFAPKAIMRFSDPRMHVYVVHRQFNEMALLESDIDYITDRFGTRVTLINELPYDCAPASSTQIKRLREEGRDVEADHMEFYELSL